MLSAMEAPNARREYPVKIRFLSGGITFLLLTIHLYMASPDLFRMAILCDSPNHMVSLIVTG